MAEPPTEDPPLGTLFNQLLTDAQAVARAEIDVARQTLLFKLASARQGLILLAGAMLLVIGATTAFLVGLAFTLAHWIGIALATLVVTVLALAAAGLFARWAMRRLSQAVAAKPEDAVR